MPKSATSARKLTTTIAVDAKPNSSGVTKRAIRMNSSTLIRRPTMFCSRDQNSPRIARDRSVWFRLMVARPKR